MIKGAIFDVDGTLLDSMGIWKDVGVRYLNSIGIEAEPDLGNILFTMINKFSGGPVGLDTLSAAIGEDPGTVEDVYEPYLIKNGFINRTPRGRIVTDVCYRHFGLEPYK
mgnify:CR=1 FL=1